MLLLAIIATIVIFAALTALSAGCLMLLLGALASVTGWPCALGFIPCFLIILILAYIK
jgi:hypothetical protein